MEQKLVQRCETKVDADACKASYRLPKDTKKEYLSQEGSVTSKATLSSFYLIF